VKLTKLLIFFVAALTSGIPAHATQPESLVGGVNVSLADISIGGIFPFANGDNAFELGVSALSLGAEHEKTGLGILFSPFNFFLWRDGDSNIEKNFSFINFAFYWNLPPGDSFYFGTFARANYFILSEGKIDWTKYIFTAGLQGGIRLPFAGLFFPIASLETGIRCIDGEFNFFVAGKIDFWSLLLVFMR
jgi:hypothetical protein